MKLHHSTENIAHLFSGGYGKRGLGGPCNGPWKFGGNPPAKLPLYIWKCKTQNKLNKVEVRKWSQRELMVLKSNEWQLFLTATECNKEQLTPFETAVVYLCYCRHCSQPAAVTIQFLLPPVWWTEDCAVFLWLHIFLGRVIYMHVTLAGCDFLTCRPGDIPPCYSHWVPQTKWYCCTGTALCIFHAPHSYCLHSTKKQYKSKL